MKFKVNYTIPIIWTGWTTLGFYRGYANYNFKYNFHHQNNLDIIEERKKLGLSTSLYENSRAQYYYIEAINSGLMYSLMYFAPFILPFTLFSELRRLEINLRGLKEEKMKKSYYDIFM
jgi:hypothetical protein